MANSRTFTFSAGHPTAMPMMRMSPVRTAARALIVQGNHLLAIAMKDQNGPFYLLPGGGQKPGETLAEAVRRECIEEIGCPVHVGPLIYIREYIGRNHRFSEAHRAFHQLESVFLCELEGQCAEHYGNGRDRLQTGLKWLPIDKLDDYPLFPEILKTFFPDGKLVVPQTYLGDIN